MWGSCSVRCGQWYPWTGDSGSNRRAGWDNHGKQQACSSSLSSTICASAPALASLVNSLEPVSCNRPITLSPPHWLWSWFYHATENKLELCFLWLCLVWFGALPYLLPWQNSHHGITPCGYSIKGSSLHVLWHGKRNQELMASCVHCYLGITVSRFSGPAESGRVSM